MVFGRSPALALPLMTPLKTLYALLIALGARAGLGAAPVSAQPAPAASAVIAAPSGANLNISPKRVTFDRNHRSATVYIFNQGSGPGTFDISLVDRVMLPDGQIVPIADAAGKADAKAVAERVKSASSVLHVAPR